MGKFYVTTAIDYVNAEPHIGHTYQKVIADVLARWHRLSGEEVFFLTGTDEHGQKIARSAEAAGLAPKEFSDQNSAKFLEAWKKLGINFDKFIRTTDPEHKLIVQKFAQKIKGDIYKGVYEGLYCVGCEAYITEKELVNGRCPFHPDKIPEPLKEETYFFKLSKFEKKLLEFYSKNPDCILPRKRANEIINRVKEGLKDLSISRKNLTWGIPYPEDNSLVIYVWFDALLNYITALDWPNGKNFKKFWPADIELLGVDNSWFHCVIWPAMLMSAGIKPAKTIFVHGFLTFNGQKISKSLGNVISPIYLAGKYGADSTRYYICRQFVFGEDGDFSEKTLAERHNNELANELGNLLNRSLSLIEKDFQGKIPNARTNAELQKKLDLKKIQKYMEKFELHMALSEIFSFINACNKFVNDRQPWKQSGKELEETLYSVADALRIISILLSPFIPETSEKINSQLGVKAGTLKDCKFNLLKAGTQAKKGEVLFKKIEIEKEAGKK
ncbi:MAG: methionine--tRNA ligase [Candidatus Diapherotrites archaeon]|nr:methionine--tRNA ligase [Candidatus Diapherotrites archaeon]